MVREVAHGTSYAVVGHRRRREPLCLPCEEWLAVNGATPEERATAAAARAPLGPHLAPVVPAPVRHDVITGVRNASAATGAAGELLAAADLMRWGYHVFRAESPSAPCDLIAMTGARLLRVEVRTGRIYLPTGMVALALRDDDLFDLLAVVIGNDVGYLGPYAPAPFPWAIPGPLRARVLSRIEAAQVA